MHSDPPYTLAQARALRARGLALPPEGLPPAVILDSWARCMEAGLAADAAASVPVVEATDLALRRERSEFVRRLAQAELETLSRQIAGSNFLLAFADHEGVILDLYADNRFSMSSSEAGIVAGSCWDESVAGTNGLGTALATGAAVAVTGLEHYFLKLGDISCTAAPVHDAYGQVVGVLDASSYYESRQRHTQALVQMAATHIENGLLAHQMRGHWLLAVHPRAEYLGTLSAGLLAFDDEGRLESVNGPGRSLLTGLDTLRGTRFEELFGEPLDTVLARLHLSGEVRLRDAMGSALVARLVSRPAASSARVLLRSGQAAQPRPLRRSADAAPPPATEAPAFLADDPAVAEACRLIEAAVRLHVPVLLHGETGTGKELLARHAHASSGRRGEFVAVNCAALPAELFEAELFGYVSGAFTGARREGSQGLIVAADGGTLLLDEIRDLPLQLQAALLRFLDDQTVRPVGGHSTRRVDVQLLAASHGDLDEAVQSRTFREDLLHRLNTVCVTLPPLRSRRDLPEAARWVLRAIDPRQTIDDAAVAALAGHAWPGNFRELRSVLTRALLHRGAARRGLALGRADLDAVLPAAVRLDTPSQLRRSAAEMVRAEFERNGHSVSRTARALGISRTTVYRHLRH
jgi:sigma-54 dependent transcriptional regulator, acetoin dehydrogenase operon transcriptional activator AcoR